VNAVGWKALAALALVPLAFDTPRRWLEARLRPYSRAVVVVVFAASRLGACALAFLVLEFALPSDVRGYYTAFAEAALTTGRHESSPYSPGFDYLLAALRWWSPNLLSVVVVMIVAEVGALALLLRFLDRHSPALSRPIAVLWLVSPVSLLHVALGGQDEALILLIWTVMASLAMGGRARAAGMALAIGVACTKLLGLFGGLPLVGQPIERTWRAAAAALAAGGVLAALLVAVGIPFGNALSESRLVTSGNVWALPVIAFGSGRPEPALAQVILALAVLAAAVVYLHRHPWPTSVSQMLRVSGTIGCVFLLVSQKSFANYLVIFLPGVLFLALQASPAVRVFLLAVALPVSAFEPSLWFYFREGDALIGSAGARAAMATADLTLVLGYVAIVRQGFRPAPVMPAAVEG
jgi:hypothetical protein